MVWLCLDALLLAQRAVGKRARGAVSVAYVLQDLLTTTDVRTRIAQLGYYVLARRQDLTEAGQFFLTPGEQRSGRPSRLRANRVTATPPNSSSPSRSGELKSVRGAAPEAVMTVPMADS